MSSELHKNTFKDKRTNFTGGVPRDLLPTWRLFHTPQTPQVWSPSKFDAKFSPASAHLFRLNELELHASAGPHDAGGVVGVVQQRYQELPELQRAALLPVVDDDIAPAGHRAATTVPLVL